MIFHVYRPACGKDLTLCGHRKMREGQSPVIDEEAALNDHPNHAHYKSAICISCARAMKPGRQMFCVALEKMVKIPGRSTFTWAPDGFTYTHANDVYEAARNLTVLRDRGTRVVAIGLVVGYHVEDSEGLILRA